MKQPKAALIQAQHWLHADPIACQTDRSAVYILGQAGLDLSEEEELELLAELNIYLQEEDLHLQRGAALQWYLVLNEASGMISVDLDKLIGQDWGQFMPTGPNKLRWQRLLIELQMLLQRSPINIARRARGAKTVDALWLWGEGRERSPQPWWKRLWK